MTTPRPPLRVLSWNVNGLRAVDRGGFFRRWMSRSDPFFVGVQEVRAHPTQLPRRLTAPRGFYADIVAAERKGYSGVALYARRQPDRVVRELGLPEMDREARMQIAEFGPLVIGNAYFPNGSGVDRDHSRVPFKLDFYRRFFDALEAYRQAGRRVLVMGDFNTAHQEIDLARPKSNRKTSGFLDVERAELGRWLERGWVDTFRAREPGPGHYTWWSQRKGVRERNIGWRLDMILACPQADGFVRRAFIWPKVKGSDHCPVGVELDPSVLEA